MDDSLKKRLIGAAVLFTVVVAVIPELLTGPAPSENSVHLQGNQQMVSIDLTSDSLKASAAQSLNKSSDEVVHTPPVVTAESVSPWLRRLWHKLWSQGSSSSPALDDSAKPAAQALTAAAGSAPNPAAPAADGAAEVKPIEPIKPSVAADGAGPATMRIAPLTSQAGQTIANPEPAKPPVDVKMERAGATVKVPVENGKSSAVLSAGQGNTAHPPSGESPQTDVKPLKGTPTPLAKPSDKDAEILRKPPSAKPTERTAAADKAAKDAPKQDAKPEPSPKALHVTDAEDKAHALQSTAVEPGKPKPRSAAQTPDQASKSASDKPNDTKQASAKAKRPEHERDQSLAADGGKPKPIHYTVHLGSFSDKQHADTLVAKLRKEGLKAHVVTSHSGADVYYRVRLAPETERDKAEKAVQQLKKLGIDARISQ